MTFIQPLVLLTLSNPRAAARVILGHAFPREALWTGLVLVAVLYAMVYTFQQIVMPLPDHVMVPRFTAVSYFLVLMAFQGAFVVSVFLCGRWIGGIGTLDDLLAVMVWLQFVQVSVLAILTIVFLVAPALAGLLNLGVTLFGLFILLHFVNEAHALGSLWKTAAVLLMASFLLGLIFTFLLGLLGPANLGLSAYV